MFNPKFRRNAAFAVVLLAGTALGGLGATLGPAVAQDPPAAAPIVPRSGPALPGFADMVARVSPAVVTITSTERVQAEQASTPFPEGSEQERSFRRFFGGGQQRQAPQAAQALGSGFLIDAGGHVVTNNHVVEGATKVVVTLGDGRALEAHVVGRDPRTDVALLKIEAGEPLPFLALGDSDQARPGDWVVAVGNPFGLGGSVTAGILSARGRDIGAGPYDNFLQVDAPINRGNSGGPLFGLDGAVLGVNTAIFSPTGGSVGIGFAIPSNLVKQVVAELQEHGRIERGYIGLVSQPVTPDIAAALKLAQPRGALVAELEPGAPAARAGLRPGDVITAVNGDAVSDPRSLARQVAALRPGSEAMLAVRRDGAERQLRLTTASLPDRSAEATPQVGGKEQGRLGLALAPIDPATRASLGLTKEVQGAVIASVRPGSPADEAGLRAGDVVQGIGPHAVTSPRDVAQAIEAQAGSGDAQGAVALRILRGGHSLFVAVPVA